MGTTSPLSPAPPDHGDTLTFGPDEELELYRRRRAGKRLSDEHERHFQCLRPWVLRMLEQMAAQHDEQDRLKRAEVARDPEGYAWHKGPGGGLPFDWSDSELTRLRPKDWKQVRTITFVKVASPRVPKQRHLAPSRAREHRPVVSRRASSSSTTSSADPPSEEPPPGAGRRCQACGADISYRRADAKTCDALCRKRLSRGDVEPQHHVTSTGRPLEDEIHERARERHLAWSAARPDRALIEDLDATLSDLYAELRRRRARRRLQEFAGRSASVVILAAPPHGWADRQGAYRRREAVAA